MSNRVGPVIMGHPIARACLESAGRVYSFRTSDRTTGETHYRYKRTGTKVGDVTIEQVTDETLPTYSALRPFQPLSGFGDVAAWREAIADVHGDTETPGHVYQIDIVPPDA